MPKLLASQLNLARCPHCNVDRPSLNGGASIDPISYAGLKKYWRIDGAGVTLTNSPLRGTVSTASYSIFRQRNWVARSTVIVEPRYCVTHHNACTTENSNEKFFSHACSQYSVRIAGVCTDRDDFTFNSRQTVGGNDGEPDYPGRHSNVHVQ